MSCYPAGIPWPKSIQEYIADPARANPLLGMTLFTQHWSRLTVLVPSYIEGMYIHVHTHNCLKGVLPWEVIFMDGV